MIASKYCKSSGIRLSGRPFDRSVKDPEILKQQRREERDDAKVRNTVKGVFGEGKRFFLWSGTDHDTPSGY